MPRILVLKDSSDYRIRKSHYHSFLSHITHVAISNDNSNTTENMIIESIKKHIFYVLSPSL